MDDKQPEVNEPDDEPLSNELIGTQTVWGDIEQAHSDSSSRPAAVLTLVNRYKGMVQRYLLGATRDPYLAEELTQEFCLRLMRGDFRGASPQRGRFRDLLRTSLSRMVIDHYRRTRRQPLSLEPDAHAEELASDELPEGVSDGAFLSVWREELMKHTWEALRKKEEHTGQLLFTVLRCLADNPGLKSPEMAVQLSAKLEKPVTADWVRKWLRLARESFADLLLYEVAQQAGTETLDELEVELADVGLLNEGCRSALQRRRSGFLGGT